MPKKRLFSPIRAAYREILKEKCEGIIMDAEGW
jgi:hypothetical protein